MHLCLFTIQYDNCSALDTQSQYLYPILTPHAPPDDVNSVSWDTATAYSLFSFLLYWLPPPSHEFLSKMKAQLIACTFFQFLHFSVLWDEFPTPQHSWKPYSMWWALFVCFICLSPTSTQCPRHTKLLPLPPNASPSFLWSYLSAISSGWASIPPPPLSSLV